MEKETDILLEEFGTPLMTSYSYSHSFSPHLQHHAPPQRLGTQRRVHIGGPYAYACLIVFLAIFLINQADRQVMAILIPSGLRCETNSTTENVTHGCLTFDDTQQGLLTGPVFSVMFTLSGIPISWIADRYNRVWVLSGGLFLWSVVMVIMYFVQQFWQLLLLQMMLGVGEATCNPTIYSMLADVFSPARRAGVFSAYNCGVYLGGGLGYLSSAINTALGWRWTLLLLGLPGFLLLIILLAFFREPVRAQSEKLAKPSSQLFSEEQHTRNYSVKESVFLLLNKPFILLCLASSVRMFSGYALGAWLATFYERHFNLVSDEYGLPVGLIVIFAGSTGSLLGGYLSDVLMNSTDAAKAYVIAISQFISAPCVMGVFLATTPTTSFVLLAFAYLTGETWLGPAAAIVQDIMPASTRALSIATYTTVNTLTGGLGPLVVGALLGSDGVCTRAYGENSGVKYALMYLMPVCYVVSGGLFVLLGWALTERGRTARASSMLLDKT